MKINSTIAKFMAAGAILFGSVAPEGVVMVVVR